MLGILHPVEILPYGPVAHEGDSRLSPHLLGDREYPHFRLLCGHLVDVHFICGLPRARLQRG